MPWTFAHPAAVLPLRRTGLPMSALVIGSIAPDVPSYVPWLSIRDWTHSATGLVTIDLAIAMVLLVAWTLLPVTARLGGRGWLLAPIAAVIGSATHVAWDSATHRDEWVTDRVPWLREEHGALLGYEWAQLVSTVVGGLVVAYAVLRRRRGKPGRLPAGTG